MDKELAIVLSAVGACVLFFVALIALPFITGSTFGQRCTKAWPEDPAQQEWCVIRLNKGGTVYPKPAGLEHPYE